VTEHEALIESILDEPKDLARQLVYADWLDEHGSYADAMRARLIRLMVEWRQMPDGSAERQQADERVKEFEKRYLWMMMPSLPPKFRYPSFDRGIVTVSAEMSFGPFLEHAEDYVRVLPPYCRYYLHLTHPPPRGKLLALLDSPAWPRVCGLRVRNYTMTPVECQSFFSGPGLRGLDTLRLDLVEGTGDEALIRLAASPFTKRLEELWLYCGGITDAGLNALAGGVPRLTELRLSRSSAIRAAAKKAFQKKRPDITECYI
jgi:uncharacterized protein (TIGR02996 family)